MDDWRVYLHPVDVTMLPPGFCVNLWGKARLEAARRSMEQASCFNWNLGALSIHGHVSSDV